jgi:hypothetical protein
VDLKRHICRAKKICTKKNPINMDLYLLQDPDSGEDNGFSTKVNLMHQSDLTMDGAKITNPKGLVEADIDGLSETVSRIDEEAAKLEADIEAGQKAQDETTATNKAEIEADLKSAVEEAAAARSAMDEATAASQKAQDEASEAGFKAATEARAAEKLARETVDASQAETANIDRAARIAADESHDTEIAAIKEQAANDAQASIDGDAAEAKSREDADNAIIAQATDDKAELKSDIATVTDAYKAADAAALAAADVEYARILAEQNAQDGEIARVEGKVDDIVEGYEFDPASLANLLEQVKAYDGENDTIHEAFVTSTNDKIATLKSESETEDGRLNEAILKEALDAREAEAAIIQTHEDYAAQMVIDQKAQDDAAAKNASDASDARDAIAANLAKESSDSRAAEAANTELINSNMATLQAEDDAINAKVDKNISDQAEINLQATEDRIAGDKVNADALADHVTAYEAYKAEIAVDQQAQDDAADVTKSELEAQLKKSSEEAADAREQLDTQFTEGQNSQDANFKAHVEEYESNKEAVEEAQKKQDEAHNSLNEEFGTFKVDTDEAQKEQDSNFKAHVAEYTSNKEAVEEAQKEQDSNFKEHVEEYESNKEAVSAEQKAQDDAREEAVKSLSEKRETLSAELKAEIAVEKERLNVLLDGSLESENTLKEISELFKSMDAVNDSELMSAILEYKELVKAAEEASKADHDAITKSLEDHAEANAADFTTVNEAHESEVAARIKAIEDLIATINALEDKTDDADAARVEDITELDEKQTKAISDLTDVVEANDASHTKAEEELGSRIDDAISNVDPAKMDSFGEVAEDVTTAMRANFDSIYQKRVEVTFDGVDKVVFASPVMAGSEMLIVNGLISEAGFDFTSLKDEGTGLIESVQFTGDFLEVIKLGARLGAYGVYGEFTSVDFNKEGES